MKLSIIIPLFNEEKTISQTLKRLLNIKFNPWDIEIIVVNDGSIDSSKLKVQSLKLNGIKIFSHAKNMGKGAAVRTGIDNATGDYILIQDADLEYDPIYIRELLEPIEKNKAKVVYGTRLKRLPNFKKDERNIRFFFHYLGNKTLSLLTSFLYRQWITDMETGYKVFPKEALLNIRLRAKGFEIEPELTAKLMKKGYKILEVPISTNPRSYKEGKKLNAFKEGPKAAWVLLKCRFLA